MKNKTPTQKIIINYIIALTPLILYGFYKNGILLYTKNLINIFDMLKPLLIPIFSFLIAFLINYLFNRKDKNALKETLIPLYALIFSCIINPSINLLLYFLILIFGLIIIELSNKKLSITYNKIAFLKLITFAVLILLGLNNYQNIYESSTTQALNGFDMFFGRGVGGIASTNIFLVLISYAYLSFFDKTYKKDIPIYIIIPYIIMIIIYSFIINNVEDIFNLIFSNSIIFAAIFIAPEILSSPISKKRKIIYGVLISLISFIIQITFLPTEAIFIAIFSISFFKNLFDKPLKKRVKTA